MSENKIIGCVNHDCENCKSKQINTNYEIVAYLWQHGETGRTKIVMQDQIVTDDNNWFVVGPLFLQTKQHKNYRGARLVLTENGVEQNGFMGDK